MYSLEFLKKKVQKRFYNYVSRRQDILSKLERLKADPRRALDAHPLDRELEGSWSCWLGSNLRMVYLIDDEQKKIFVLTIGTHNTVY